MKKKNSQNCCPKVVHIITRLDLGGAQKVCLLLFNGLLNDGKKAFLISGREGGYVENVIGFESVYLLRNLKHAIGLKSIWLDIKAFFNIISLLRRLKKEHPDLIVHTHTPKAGILGRWAAFFAGVKKRVHTIHGLSFNDFQIWPVRFLIKFVEFVTGFITSHFVCVSKADYQICLKFYPNFIQKSSVIYPAVDFLKFLPAKRCADFDGSNLKQKIVIGTVSCFKGLKNVDRLIEIFRKLKKDLGDKFDLALEVVGDGLFRKRYEQLVFEGDMEDSIKLLGWRKDVDLLMGEWDVFAFTSLKEGLPCVLVEARFVKLPVVAYEVGGISEIINHNQNGFLVKINDEDTFLKKLKLLIQDKELRKRLSLFNDDLSFFKDEYMYKKYFEIYSEI